MDACVTDLCYGMAHINTLFVQLKKGLPQLEMKQKYRKMKSW